jgi:NAD(P)H-hydrate repair Nnr-like enzyme with NAD(P)H-hydrate dehydratase domain
MLAVVGTVPDRDFPLAVGEVSFEEGEISIAGKRVPINRGTPALLAAAIKTGETLGGFALFAYLVGDIGLGDGSRRLYAYIRDHLGENDPCAIAFHYVQPDVEWHDRILYVVDMMDRRPVLIADAGFMYAAKMSGRSPAYDLFNPDSGELAFLADEAAPHPFYTRGFILHEENRVPEQIARAYAHHNAPRYLLVKGRRDYLAYREGILATIESPMEAIGGTGDTLTGIVAALSARGMEISEAAVVVPVSIVSLGFMRVPLRAPT